MWNLHHKIKKLTSEISNKYCLGTWTLCWEYTKIYTCVDVFPERGFSVPKLSQINIFSQINWKMIQGIYFCGRCSKTLTYIENLLQRQGTNQLKNLAKIAEIRGYLKGSTKSLLILVFCKDGFFLLRAKITKICRK